MRVLDYKKWEKGEKLSKSGDIFEYNHLRRHGGLEYITLYEKLEKVTELLS